MIHTMTNYLNDCRTNGIDVCLSGGAIGSDHFFSNYALGKSQTVINYIFDSHNSKCDEDTLLKIPNSVLNSVEIQNKLKQANVKLLRKVPKIGTYVYKLLARNYFQIKDTDRVYAISTLISPSQISGGTAWAVQMYLDMHTDPELYLYDYITKKKYKYCNQLNEYVEIDTVPEPYGIWTGIGSRDAPDGSVEDFIYN